MWTKLTIHTKTGLAAIKKVGISLDRQYDSDSAPYWRTFWGNTDRQHYLRQLRAAFAPLDKAAKKKAPFADIHDCTSRIRDAAYYLGNIRSRRILLRSTCAGTGAEELRAILKAKMFEAVFLNEPIHNLNCITRPVIITAKDSREEFAMGRYNVCWTYKPVCLTARGNFSFPAHANLRSHHSIHPHIHSNGAYCGGELMESLPGLFSHGLFTDAMLLILQYLQTGEGHPYRDLAYWRQGGSASATPTCSSCHTDKAVRVRACRYCFATVCQPCRQQYSPNCPKCGHKLTIKTKAKKVEQNVKKTKKKKTKRSTNPVVPAGVIIYSTPSRTGHPR